MRYAVGQQIAVLYADYESAMIERTGGTRLLLTVVRQFDGTIQGTWDSDYTPEAYGETPSEFYNRSLPGIPVPEHLRQGNWQRLTGYRPSRSR